MGEQLRLPTMGMSALASCDWHWWRLILDAQSRGRAALPSDLGLAPDVAWLLWLRLGLTANGQHDELRQQLLELRASQRQQLEALLLGYAVNVDSPLMARVVATAAMASGHLWQELGMPDRPTLRLLLTHHFPALVARNVHNLRWKKFFYRLLCEQGGDYLCPAPNCSDCHERQSCMEDSAG